MMRQGAFLQGCDTTCQSLAAFLLRRASAAEYIAFMNGRSRIGRSLRLEAQWGPVCAATGGHF